MTTTNAVNSITNSLLSQSVANAPTTAAAATNQLSYDDFLTLLMTELQHQDPTQPMDPTQMVSQLATVSDVGQAVQANKTLSALLTSTSLSQAETMIGQTVTSSDGQTTGVVQSVTVSSTGTTATLGDGSHVQLSTGATVQ
jgi:flagellar basal-body rod modification protein FlgD